MMRRIDLNADLGEGCGDDAAIMTVVTRCNIACGGHAGDPESMTAALALAKQHGVAAGAHPSYPDRENFGRMQMDLHGEDLRAALTQQVQELKDIAVRTGLSLAHLKPHGALYNFAAEDLEAARIIADVTAALIPGGALLGPPGSRLQEAAEAAGISFFGEAFADRVYERDGSLRPRALPGALITDDRGCAAQAMQIVLKGTVTSHDGQPVPVPAKTICLHSDTPGALLAARRVRAMLQAEGIEVSANV